MPPAELAVTIGARVRLGRGSLGLTRRQFAAKAGVSERYLNELENGVSNASIAIIEKLAAALGQTPASLMSTLASEELPIPSNDLRTLIATMTAAEQHALLSTATAWLAERRRSSKGIALLGLRGAGKSSLGQMLANRHGVPLVSITVEIERKAGMNLSEIFNLGGPNAYRAMENEVVAGLVGRPGRIVLETAGGITGNSAAIAMILARFKTVWLKATPEEHLARVSRQGDMRPMQGNPRALESLKALLAEREAEYARADVAIDTSRRSIEDCFADLAAIAADMFEEA